MSDPSLLPEGTAGLATAATGGGGLVFILGKLADRWLKKEDDSDRETLALLNEIKTSVGSLGTDVKLLVQAHTATRADVDKLEATVSVMQLQFAELRGRFEHLSEQLAK